MMRFLSRLTGRREQSTKPALLATFVAEFAAISGIGLPVDTPDALGALTASGLLVELDWADDPLTVAKEIGQMLCKNNGPNLSESLLSEAKAATADTPRGKGVLPTAAKIDQAIMGAGKRLLWIEFGSDSFLFAAVPSDFHARWQNVKLSAVPDIAALNVDLINEYPRQRMLVSVPRLAAGQE